jgi:hypothetical protein
MANISEEKWIEMLEKKADGSYIAKYPKVKSKSGVTFDEHLAERATLNQLGHVKAETTEDGTLIIPEPDIPIVTGTYVGNGASSRFISLGFTPRAVLLFDSEGRVSSEYDWDGTMVQMHGGLAFDGRPVKLERFYTMSFVALEITPNGFTVKIDGGSYGNNSATIATNASGVEYRYVALR